MVKATPNRAISATRMPEEFNLQGATVNGGAGPFIDYALEVRGVGQLASAMFDDIKATNASYSGGFDVTLLILLRPLGYIRPQDFGVVAKDPYLAAKLGADRLPDPSSVSRSLHRLEGDERREGLRALNRQILEPALLAEGAPPHVILDVDSSVEVVYGDHMEGAAKGYNPRAMGRDSYHPLIFSDGARDIVLDARLRSGNAGDKQDLLEHYREMRDWLSGIGRPIQFARMDRGFRGESVFAELEADQVGYAIKARETSRLVDARRDVAFSELTCEGDEEQIEATAVEVKLGGWSCIRRVVTVRRRLRESDQLYLGDTGWRYESIVTNLDWSPEDVWRFYNRRCQAENLIKELKAGYGIDKLSTGSFGANDADLVLKVISYNLMWAFRHDALPAKWRPFTIRTLRNLLLRVAGVLRSHAGRSYVRLASWHPHQEVFAGIRGRVDALAGIT